MMMKINRIYDEALRDETSPQYIQFKKDVMGVVGFSVFYDLLDAPGGGGYSLIKVTDWSNTLKISPI